MVCGCSDGHEWGECEGDARMAGVEDEYEHTYLRKSPERGEAGWGLVGGDN